MSTTNLQMRHSLPKVTQLVQVTEPDFEHGQGRLTPEMAVTYHVHGLLVGRLHTPGFASYQPVQHWVRCLNSLGLSFLLCKMGGGATLPSCREAEMKEH